MPITVSWSLKGQELNSGPSITTNMIGQRASLLIIASVDYTHIGEYTCRATNPAGSVTHSADLKVNGKSWSHRKALEIVLLINVLNLSFLFRATRSSSILLWFICCEHRSVCTTDLRGVTGRHAHQYHLEPQGRKVEFKSRHHNNYAGTENEHAGHSKC